MKVFTVEYAEYSWDKHEILGIYSTEDKATEAMVGYKEELFSQGIPENRISIYVNDWNVDESN